MKRTLNVVRYTDSVKVQKRSGVIFVLGQSVGWKLEEATSRLTEIARDENKQVKDLRLE